MTSVVDIVVMGRSSMTSSSRSVAVEPGKWHFITTFHLPTCLATALRANAPLIFPMHPVESAAHLESGAEDLHGTFDSRVSAEAQVVLNLAAPASL